MRNGRLVLGCTAMISAALVISSQAAGPQTSSSSSNDARTTSASTQRGVFDRDCVTCHTTSGKAAGLEPAHKLTLHQLDLAHVGENADVWEQVVRKPRAGMMPPSGMRRPDPTTRDALVAWLENELDRTAVTHLPPPELHRLN